MMAKTVKMLRKIFGYSRDTLAEKIGYTSVDVTAMESGKEKMSFDTLNKLSAVYNLPLRKIVELDEINGKIDLSLDQVRFMILDYMDNDTESFLDTIEIVDDFDKYRNYRNIDVARFTKKHFILHTNNYTVDGNVTSCDFINLFSYNDEELSRMVDEDEKNYKGALSFNEYLYLCLSNFDGDFGLDNKVTDRIWNIKKNYMSKVEYVSAVDQIVCHNKYCKFPDFEINEDLVKFLNEDIDPNYTSDERILYYYFKMCSLFEHDSRYLFALLISKPLNDSKFKKSPNRLSSLGPSNNCISCFEFEAVLNKLIQKEEGLTEIQPFTGSSAHVYTGSVINRRYYAFDAFESPIDPTAVCDLINVKMGHLYTGVIASVNDFYFNKPTYYQHVDKIYNDVRSKMNFDRKKFDPSELETCFSAIDCLKVSDLVKHKLKCHFKIFNDYPLNNVEFCLALIKNRSFDFSDILKLTCVSSTMNDYKTGLVLSVRQHDDQYRYFYFGEDDTIKVFNEEKMTELISDNKIIISESTKGFETIYRTIPGIDPEFQKNMNKVAAKTILPKLFKSVYEESSSTKGVQKRKSDNS